MKYRSLNEIREMYLRFFESKDHKRLPSFSLIPQNDPSLLLINSGMAPMKLYFTGEQKPPRARVTTCQKCIRTGDIENVGKTARHGTFFEMLGNFSFGDYFKKEAIAWSWEFLTSDEWIGIDPKLLYPSIYEEDEEAFEIWNQDIGIAPERIFRFGKEDNFWEHGAGPCGPCSEIYYDRGEEHGCGKPDCTVGCDCDRYMEVWNNVFSQFNNDGKGNYTELAQKNIDTGMGLERLACVVQGVASLFDVDTVHNITAHVSKISGKQYGDSENTDISLRVITDHIRSTVMLVCDGVIPSNEGRGYVLRRLLRRAARHGKLIGIDHPFLSEVANTVIEESGAAYPELMEKKSYINKVIQNEELSFDKTIDAGLSILENMIKACGESKELPAENVFKLYDTYGFPIDLTLEILEEHQMSTNREQFDVLMDEQRQRAREDRKKMGDLGWTSESIDLGAFDRTAFDGYTTLSEEVNILAVIHGGALATDANADSGAVTLVLDRTPFYAESGGQVCDHGEIKTQNGIFTVKDVQKTKDGKFLHIGEVVSGVISVNEVAQALVDKVYREAICRSHTATHLLQKALRTILGSHVEQAGAYTAADHVRFDFTHFSALTPKEITQIEQTVNASIFHGYPVFTEEMPIEDAKKLGAMALFGEKYGDVVRVVQVGDYSIELCGGTHVDNTAKVGMFKLVSEASVAAGVRRIDAYTGLRVLDYMNEQQEQLTQTCKLLKTNPHDLTAKVAQTLDETKEFARKIEKLNAKLATAQLQDVLASAVDVSGYQVIAAQMHEVAPDALRNIGDTLKHKNAKMIAVLGSAQTDGKVSLVCVCGADTVKNGAHAGKIIKEVAQMCGGGGGGKPDSATAGGKDASKLQDALAAVTDIVSKFIS